MNTLNFLKKLDVDSLVDFRGNLDIAELGGLDEFAVKRIYYISNVPKGVERGAHAHKSLKQVFFAISGSFTLKVTNGVKSDLVQLNSHSCGYFLPSGYWRDLSDFSQDAICLVLASECYDPNDYIHTIDEFLDWRISLEKS
jgi:hypothetical protein